MTDQITPSTQVHHVEVAIAGAGFGGLCMAIKLQEAGMESAVDEARPLQQVISEEIKIHADLVKAAGLVPQ